MAEIEVEKKKPVWPWIILVIVILALLYFFVFADDGNTQQMNENEINTEEVEPVSSIEFFTEPEWETRNFSNSLDKRSSNYV